MSETLVVRRVEALQKAGFEVHLYGYHRTTMTEYQYDTRVIVKNLGVLENGKGYFHKLQLMRKDITEIIKSEGRGSTIYYGFGFLIGNILSFCHVNYIYEICDLLYGYGRLQKVSQLFRIMDRRAIRKSLLTVLTSDGFHKYLFKKPQDNILIQPNRVNQFFTDIERLDLNKVDVSHLKFAYVGAPRSKSTVLHFAKVIGRYYPNHEFHFYGDGPSASGFMLEASDYANVFFHGRFKNPHDLMDIYNNIDIVVACYETEALNERLLEPNKLYEAIYFNKPIIVSENSYLADRVKNLNCGYVINAYSENAIRNFIDNLSQDSIYSVRQSEKLIHTCDTIDSSTNLINRILELYN